MSYTVKFWTFLSLCNVCYSCDFMRTGRYKTLVDTTYSRDKIFWIKPTQTFDYIKFVLKKDTKLDFQFDKFHDEVLSIKSSAFKINQWNHIDFRIYKRERSYKPDLYSLEATVNGKRKFTVNTRLWWALTVIKQTYVYVYGESDISFYCKPVETTPTQSTTTTSIITPSITLSTTTPSTATPMPATNPTSTTTSVTSTNQVATVTSTAISAVISSRISTATISTSLSVILRRLNNTDISSTTSSSSPTFLNTTKEVNSSLMLSNSTSLMTPTSSNITAVNMTAISSPNIINFVSSPENEIWTANNSLSHIDTTPVVINSTETAISYTTVNSTTEPIIINNTLLISDIFSQKFSGSTYYFIGIIFLCLVIVVPILIFIILHYKAKIKKMKNSDLSNIESLEPKNLSNHYDFAIASKIGIEHKEALYEEIQMVSQSKVIMWQEKDCGDHEYDRPSSAQSFNSERNQEYDRPKSLKLVTLESNDYDKPRRIKLETEENQYEELPSN